MKYCFDRELRAAQLLPPHEKDASPTIALLCTPVISNLLSKAHEANHTICRNLHDRVPAVLRASTLDHSDQSAVVDATNVLKVVLMTVAL